VIISDLQHIESAIETQVQGGNCDLVYTLPYRRPPQQRREIPGDPLLPLPSNVASADAGAQAFGTNTVASTTTSTLVIQGQFSGSSSSSFAAAS
jgi:hypothetical protein